MNRVGQMRHGLGGPALDDGAEGLIGRDLPFHIDAGGGHAEPDLQGFGRQTGPQDDAVGRRLARGDAQLERSLGEDGLSGRAAADQGGGHHQAGRRAEAADQGAAGVFEPLVVSAGHGRPPLLQSTGLAGAHDSTVRPL